MSTPSTPEAFGAERAVLGAVLRDPRAIDVVADWLRPEQFELHRHRVIYAAMLAVHRRNDPPDRVLILDELRRTDTLTDAGGELEIIDLHGEVPHAAHIEQHARLIEQTAILRGLIEAGGRIAALGYDRSRDIDDISADAERIVQTALAGHAQRDRASTMRSVMDGLFEQMHNRTRGGASGLLTGYHDLDKLTGGLQPSDLIVLAARPGFGKTSLALSIAYNVALMRVRDTYAPGVPVGVFSMEMSSGQLGQRLLAMHTGIDMQRIRVGDLRGDEVEVAVAAMGELSEAAIVIDQASILSIRDVQRRARRMHADHGLGLLIVDYIQLMSANRSENRVQEISEISRGLKVIARELDIPVVALSQLSRGVESRQSHVPMLSDLRDGGSIEQDADIVMFLYREDRYDKDTDKKGIVELHIAKHRNGPLGVVALRFEDRTTRFLNLDRYRAPEGY